MRYVYLIVLMALGLSACMSPMPEAGRASLGGNRVVLVGKFDLVPPLEAGEQTTRWNVIGDGDMLNTLIMLTGPKPIDIDPNDVGLSDTRDAMKVKWGQTFFLSAPREKVHLLGGMMFLDAGNQEKVWFPANYYFSAPKQADAIYIGTLRYYRGDFYEIEKVRLINEYAEANAEFRKRFGRNAKLVKAPLKSF